MIKRPSSEPRKIDRARLFKLTNVAVDKWLVDSGMVRKGGEIARDRTLKSYGLTTPHLNNLSTHVVDVVKMNTGVDFSLTTDQLSKLIEGSIGTYINGIVDHFAAALPGEPRTLPEKPGSKGSAKRKA